MNRSPFNRTGFNRTAQTTGGAGGTALMKMRASAVPFQEINTPLSSSRLIMTGTGNALAEKRGSGVATLRISGYGKAQVNKNGGVGLAELILSASANPMIQGEAVINLRRSDGTWLVLAPGDELVINTEDMTVTLNSQNAIEYFSVDSDFFNLLTGENKIVYSDTSSIRNVLVDILWKDRWL